MEKEKQKRNSIPESWPIRKKAANAKSFILKGMSEAKVKEMLGEAKSTIPGTCWYYKLHDDTEPEPAVLFRDGKFFQAKKPYRKKLLRVKGSGFNKEMVFRVLGEPFARRKGLWYTYQTGKFGYVGIASVFVSQGRVILVFSDSMDLGSGYTRR